MGGDGGHGREGDRGWKREKGKNRSCTMGRRSGVDGKKCMVLAALLRTYLNHSIMLISYP